MTFEQGLKFKHLRIVGGRRKTCRGSSGHNQAVGKLVVALIALGNLIAGVDLSHEVCPSHRQGKRHALTCTQPLIDNQLEVNWE